MALVHASEPTLQLKPGTVLVVHAHPDDEVFATGAATLAAKAAGHRVVLRVFTGGEGRTATPTTEGLREARRHRAAQLDESAALLGIDEWAYIDEGRWVDTPHFATATLAAAPRPDLALALTIVLDSVAPASVLTVGPDGLTGHPDHVACHQAVATAAQSVLMPSDDVWGAVVHTDQVEAAQRKAQHLLGAAVGSGRVTGRNSHDARVLRGPAHTELHRRMALNAYAQGLGTGDLEHMIRSHPRTSDSLLMRLILDLRGWDYDTLVPVNC